MQQYQDYLSPRHWLAAWVIVFGSMGIFFWLVFDGAMGNAEQRYFHLDVPGSMEFPHLGTGHHYIYQEFNKSGDSKEDLKPGGFKRLAFTITPTDGGPALTLKEVEHPSRFVIRRVVCESVYEFNVDKAGPYRINAEYNSGQEGGTYRAAVGQPNTARALRNFFIGLVVLTAGGVGVSYVLYRGGVLKSAPPSE